MTIVSLCQLAQASTYVCTQPGSKGAKTIAYILLNGNGDAAIQFGNKKAYGKYSEQHASCPSRNCGNFRIGIQAAVPNASYGGIGSVTAQIVNQSFIPSSGISFNVVGGRAPMSYNVDCKLIANSTLILKNEGNLSNPYDPIRDRCAPQGARCTSTRFGSICSWTDVSGSHSCRNYYY